MFEQSGVLHRAGLNPLIRKLPGLEREVIRGSYTACVQTVTGIDRQHPTKKPTPFRIGYSAGKTYITALIAAAQISKICIYVGEKYTCLYNAMLFLKVTYNFNL